MCRACNKNVYKMEEMKAEKSIWHKNCFRCSECSKPLRYVPYTVYLSRDEFQSKIPNANFCRPFSSVDTFESHLGILYCKQHFKSLFSPRAVEDSEPGELD